MTLFPLMQLAGRGPDLPAAVGTEEVGHGNLLRVQFPTGCHSRPKARVSEWEMIPITAGARLSAHCCMKRGIALWRSMKITSASGHAARISAAYSFVTFFGVLTSTGSARGPASSGGIS